MIDSILKRHQDPVVFYNIKTEDTIVTEPKQIKEEVRKHYEKWTQANPFNPEKWTEWATEYEPIQSIDPTWFKTLKNPITLSELEKTLSETPNNKTTGPQNISNEMLKHLNTYEKNTFLKILNACIDLQIIPKSWNQSKIYLISKKQIFSDQLTDTRPITLVEHARKVLTKILTKRLNSILSRRSILHPCNNVALPNTSTKIPISTIIHIIEDAHVNKKELWLLSQDISK